MTGVGVGALYEATDEGAVGAVAGEDTADCIEGVEGACGFGEADSA
jgi:hypothetical protein